jgi:hypothetical protein
MSKSHKHVAEDEKEKAINQSPKPETNIDTATKPSDPGGFQEFTEGSFSPISVPDETNTASDAAKTEDTLMSLMSQPQQHQKPQPKPHPQQKNNPPHHSTRSI